MELKPVAGATVGSRDDVRLAVDREADVANETFIQNRVDLPPVVNSPLSVPYDTRTAARSKCFH